MTTDMPVAPTAPHAIATFDAVVDELARLHPSLPCGSLRPGATLAELGLDSLSLMEFVFAIEDRFQVRIPEQELDVRQADLSLRRVCEALDAAVASRAA